MYSLYERNVNKMTKCKCLILCIERCTSNIIFVKWSNHTNQIWLIIGQPNFDLLSLENKRNPKFNDDLMQVIKSWTMYPKENKCFWLKFPKKTRSWGHHHFFRNMSCCWPHGTSPKYFTVQERRGDCFLAPIPHVF